MEYTDEDCIRALQNVAEDIGESPSWDDYLKSGERPGVSTISDRFGGWNDAKIAAGLETVGNGFEWRDGKLHPPTVTEDREGYYRMCIDGQHYALHRLIAIANYGVNEVCDNVVHHKNGVIIDNRPENLEPMSRAAHTSFHQS